MSEYKSRHTGGTIDDAVDKAKRLPSTTGTAGQVLKSTGSGMEWGDEEGGSGAVSSVNGQTGAVELNADDVGAYTKAASDARYAYKGGGGGRAGRRNLSHVAVSTPVTLGYDWGIGQAGYDYWATKCAALAEAGFPEVVLIETITATGLYQSTEFLNRIAQISRDAGLTCNTVKFHANSGISDERYAEAVKSVLSALEGIEKVWIFNETDRHVKNSDYFTAQFSDIFADYQVGASCTYDGYCAGFGDFGTILGFNAYPAVTSFGWLANPAEMRENIEKRVKSYHNRGKTYITEIGIPPYAPALMNPEMWDVTTKYPDATRDDGVTFSYLDAVIDATRGYEGVYLWYTETLTEDVIRRLGGVY